MNNPEQQNQTHLTTPAMSEDFKVNYATLDPNSLIFADRAEKAIPPEKEGQPSPGKYYEIPVFYNFTKIDGTTVAAPLRIELPELTSVGGIITKVNKKGFKEWSISSKVPRHGDGAACIQMFNTLVKAGAQAIGKIKGLVGKPHFVPEMPEASGFKNPLYYVTDKVTNEVRTAFDPTIYLNLYQQRVSGYLTKTLFTRPDNQELDWELLKGVTMTFIPVIEIQRMSITTSGISYRFRLYSAIVTSVVALNSESCQKDTASRLKEQRPEIVSQLDMQIKTLLALRSKVQAEATDNSSAGTPPPASDGLDSNPDGGVTSATPSSPAPVVPQVQPSPPAVAIPSMQSFLQQGPTLKNLLS